MTAILLRAASGPSVGLGHARRTRAVAQALAALGATPRLVVDDEESAAELLDEGFDARVGGVEACDAAWLDGRRDWSDEVAELQSSGARTVLVENRTPAREGCDALVYPALHYEPDDWDREHGECVHGGAEWVPLAREVLAVEWAAERDLDLLVTFGGS
ncbi:MAG: hypothetical protein O7B99_05840, partial [Planctomycetota bacterium]|nr:hypothetical protein [Planctomycetota bacterium]